MKTQNTKKELDFKKKSIAELNDNQLRDVNGGSSPWCIIGSIAAVVFVAGVIKGATDEITNP